MLDQVTATFYLSFALKQPHFSKTSTRDVATNPHFNNFSCYLQ